MTIWLTWEDARSRNSLSHPSCLADLSIWKLAIACYSWLMLAWSCRNLSAAASFKSTALDVLAVKECEVAFVVYPWSIVKPLYAVSTRHIGQTRLRVGVWGSWPVVSPRWYGLQAFSSHMLLQFSATGTLSAIKSSKEIKVGFLRLLECRFWSDSENLLLYNYH